MKTLDLLEGIQVCMYSHRRQRPVHRAEPGLQGRLREDFTEPHRSGTLRPSTSAVPKLSIKAPQVPPKGARSI